MRIERAIKLAFDRKSGNFLDADELFAKTKDAFAIREEYSKRLIEPYCYECDQPLHIAASKLDRLFFKHGPNAASCILKDQDFTSFEAFQFSNILRGKESNRHRYLKNRIAELLNITEGIEPGSIYADTQYIFQGKEKRRPDVYCRYKGKEIVFEIQLSALSQKYLLDRHQFYKQKGIYLVWILDAFDVQGQSHTERDIKYLSSFQNFFKLDESSIQFRLICTYKSPFITDKNQVITPWQTRSLTLDQLNFSAQELQLYYLDYAEKLKSERQKLDAFLENIEIENQKKIDQEFNARMNTKVVALINKIAYYRKNNWSFYQFPSFLDNLNQDELVLLNQKLNFNKIHKGKPLINHYIHITKEKEDSFIDFLLAEHRISMDVNLTSEEGISCFQEILHNPNLYIYRNTLFKNVFMRGYNLSEGDIDSYRKFPHRFQEDLESEIFILNCYNSLSNRYLSEYIYRNNRLLTIIESAKKKEIIGTRLRGWMAFAMNAITSYKRYWKYIHRAFEYYGLLPLIIENDKKGNFQRKMEEYQLNMPEQQEDVDELLLDLFPEVFH